MAIFDLLKICEKMFEKMFEKLNFSLEQIVQTLGVNFVKFSENTQRYLLINDI